VGIIIQWVNAVKWFNLSAPFLMPHINSTHFNHMELLHSFPFFRIKFYDLKS